MGLNLTGFDLIWLGALEGGCHGIDRLRIGFFLQPKAATLWRLVGVVKRIKRQIDCRSAVRLPVSFAAESG